MSSNLPPGVTGRELEIAGPDSETESHEFCKWCGSPQDGYTCTYRYQRWFECERCNDSTDMDPLPEPAIPDLEYEEEVRQNDRYSDWIESTR